MATNPMQRRARNSFLLGVLITTLILGLLLAGLGYLFVQTQNKQKELQATTVYVLKKDITSGEEVTVSDLEAVQVPTKLSPSNKISPDKLEGNVIAKVDLKKGTVATSDLLKINTTSIGNDVRRQEYNSIVLPTELETGDYVDVRLLLPSGQDFIVVSKKKVEVPNIAGVDSATTIYIELSEDEILSMSNAIVEAYMINGSKLYATKYTDPGNQEKATETYPINAEVLELLRNNQNIENEAKSALASRYNSDLRNNYINRAINSQEDALGNEQTKMQESITNSQTSREEYLQSLGGSAID